MKDLRTGRRVLLPGPALIRLGAVAVVLGGALLVVTPIMRKVLLPVLSESAGESETLYSLWLYTLFCMTLVLLPLGMAGFHLLQHRDYGRLGKAGVLAVVLSSLILALGLGDYLWREDSGLFRLIAPVGTSGLIMGFVLYGIATLRARKLPRWCGLAFAGALPAAIALLWVRPLFGFSEGASTTAILFGLLWLWLGYALLYKEAR